MKRIHTLLLGCALLAGCTVGPDYKSPAPPATSGFIKQSPADTASAPTPSAGNVQYFAPGADIPADWWTVFHSDPLDQLVRQALANRADLASELASEKASEVNSLGTKNGILPSLTAFAVESDAGLAGVPRTVSIDGFTESGNKYFGGGIGNALGQVFRRNFPTQSGGVFYQEPLRNRQAQADYSIDLLTLRQTQLTNHKDLNQVEVDVRNGVVALQQARARFDAAVRNRTLQQELFDAEAKRFRLGASTPYNVALQQRDLINAQSAAVAATVAYSTARVTLDQTLGITLEANHIDINEVKSGKIGRNSAPPANRPAP